MKREHYLEINKKLIAVVLIICLTISNWMILGSYFFSEVYAKEVETDKSKDVIFEAKFLNKDLKEDYSQKLNADVNENYVLNLKIENKNGGYLKDAYIEFVSPNYNVSNMNEENEYVEKLEDGKIFLNTIKYNDIADMNFNINVPFTDRMTLEQLNSESKIILNGIYVNSNGKETKVDKEIEVNVSWTSNYNLNISEEIFKFIKFDNNGKTNILLQTIVNINLDKEQKLPIKELNVDIEPVILNNNVPDKISIKYNDEKIDSSTEENLKNNWKYDEEKNKINIKLNTDESNNEYVIGSGVNTFLVTYIYDENSLKNISSSYFQFKNKINAEATILDIEDKKIASEYEQEFNEELKDGNIVSFSVENIDSEINKGKIYANYNKSDNFYETDYELLWNVDISYEDVVDGLELSDLGTYYINSDNSYYEDSNIIYSKTIINKDNFLEILGQDGYINIYNDKGEQIGKIDINMQTDEENNFVYNYENEVKNIKIVTSKPVAEGKLSIKHKKIINSYRFFSLNDFKNFKYLENRMEGKTVNEELNHSNVNNKIVLTESKTNPSISLNNDNLSTIATNENVELKIVLNNNLYTSDLYKNPEFIIEFPQYISDVNIKNYNLLFDDELQIIDIIKQQSDGKFYIKITTRGNQTDFITDKIINGTTIILNLDIYTDIKTPNLQDKINLYYYNENVSKYETEVVVNGELLGLTSANVNFIAPIGMVTSTQITNYNNDEKVFSFNQGPKDGKLEILTNEKISTTKLTILNNTGNLCNNIVAIGNIPFKNNKNVMNGEDLGTTIDTNMVSLIRYNGNAQDIDIYYSESNTVKYDLNDVESNWTMNPEHIENIKYFMIVVKKELNQSDIMEFEYDLKIPAMLEHNTYLYGSFGVIYNNNYETGSMQESSIADKVGLTTGRGPQMEVKQEVSVGNENPVSEGQKIKYNIKVTNTGIDPIYELVVRDSIPKGTSYVQYERINWQTEYEVQTPNANELLWNIGELGVGNSIELEFEVLVDDLPTIEEYYADYENFGELNGEFFLMEDGNKKIITNIPQINVINTVRAQAKDLEKEIQSNTLENQVISPELIVTETTSTASDVLLKENEDIKYNINVINNMNDTMKDVSIKKYLPDGLKYKDAYTLKYNADTDMWEKDLKASYDEKTRMISLNVNSLDSKDNVQLKVEATTTKLEDNEDLKQLETDTVAQAYKTAQYHSEEQENTIAKSKVDIEYICKDQRKYIKDGETLEYEINVKNTSMVDIDNVQIKDFLPEELEVINATYKIGDGTVVETLEGKDGVEAETNLLVGQTLTLNIKAQVKAKNNDVQITNRVVVSGENIDEIEKNNISHIIEGIHNENIADEIVQENPGAGNSLELKQENERVYAISGYVWIDDNKNGIMEDNETKLNGIETLAYDVNSKTIVTSTLTENMGKYRLEGLKEGEYIVIFKYDTETYIPTAYRKIEDTSKSSSSILANINLNGNTLEGAISNSINVNNLDAENINLGITEKPVFDLTLDASIINMVLNEDGKVKEYRYDYQKLAKLDIAPDKLNNSEVFIEYEINVKNEGNTPGYAKSIVSYLPAGLEFNADINNNWYLGSNGIIYSKELAQELINPGETKTVKLVLNKNMTEYNTGINLNTIEIAEDYNEFGVEDIDSKVKNKAQSEDDISEVVALITVQTGGGLFFLVIALVVLILILGIVAINRSALLVQMKKKAKKEIYK